MDARQIDDLVNRRSGLLGVSETSPEMRDLLDRQADDPRAADAVALFCYQAKKWVGAFSAALGGLETLVFAGGSARTHRKCALGSVTAWVSSGFRWTTPATPQTRP